MIYGIGVDIEDVSRIKAVIKGRESFIGRFFSNAEQELFAAKGYNPETVCGNFCSKEAFVKALGTGFRGIALKDIEVLRDELGSPYYRISGALAEKLSGMGLKYHLSLSHTAHTAVAFAIIERDEALSLADNSDNA